MCACKRCVCAACVYVCLFSCACVRVVCMRGSKQVRVSAQFVHTGVWKLCVVEAKLRGKVSQIP